MNKQYYSFGNPFKVKFREHFCYKCGTKLFIIKHSKVVNRKSEDAKYYDFPICSIGIGQKEKRRNRFSYAVRLCFYLVFWVLYGKNRGFQPILLHTLIVTRGR